MDFAWLLAAMRRRWLVVLLCLLAGAGGGYYLGHSQAKVYQATSRSFITIPNASGLTNQLQAQNLSGTYVQTFARVATSVPVAERIVRSLGLQESPQAVAGSLSASAVANTYLIDITAHDSDPVLAAQIANAAAAGLSAEVNQLEAGKGARVQAQVLQLAAVPSTPISPRPNLDLTVGLLLGLVTGTGAAALIESLDRTIRSVAQAEAAYGAPMLALVPQRADDEPIAFGPGRAPITGEPYRSLRTSLRFIDPDRPVRTLLVTSATPEDGKSTTAANLAIALSLAGDRVILVDADLRRAGLAELLGLERSAGLTSMVLGQASLAEVMQTSGRDLQVLETGPLPPNPSEILGSQLFNGLLQQLAGVADIVIIDAPPVLPVADAMALAVQVDGVLMVARHGATQRHAATEARRRIEAVGGRIVGFVYNAVPKPQSRGYYADYTYNEAPRDSGARASDAVKL